jgi:hypothetical protein
VTATKKQKNKEKKAHRPEYLLNKRRERKMKQGKIRQRAQERVNMKHALRKAGIPIKNTESTQKLRELMKEAENKMVLRVVYGNKAANTIYEHPAWRLETVGRNPDLDLGFFDTKEEAETARLAAVRMLEYEEAK